MSFVAHVRAYKDCQARAQQGVTCLRPSKQPTHSALQVTNSEGHSFDCSADVPVTTGTKAKLGFIIGGHGKIKI